MIKCPNCGFEQAGIIVWYFDMCLAWCPKCGTLIRLIRNKKGELVLAAFAKPDPTKTMIVIARQDTKIPKRL